METKIDESVRKTLQQRKNKEFTLKYKQINKASNGKENERKWKNEKEDEKLLVMKNKRKEKSDIKVWDEGEIEKRKREKAM